MIKYAMIKVGLVPSKNVGARVAFYSALCFNIGGYLYSFDEWEHGILRGNAKPPHDAAEVFQRSDVRRLFVAKHLDPRIHFCLHRGTRSCPLLFRFSAKHLKRELAAAAVTFCENDANVQFDKESHELVLSHVFQSYRSDFVVNEKHLSWVIASYLTGTTKHEILERAMSSGRRSIKILYRRRDWSGDGYLRGCAFDPAMLETTEQAQGIYKFLPSSPPRKTARRTK
jgi:Protein of unknown function, DUF547